MSGTTDVAIVGAGPYGLALAAHLRAAGVDYRQFGIPMNLWRSTMPKGMYLKSQGFASNISDPKRTHTLEAFCQATDRPYASYGLPVSLDTFVAYGQWFQNGLGLEIEETLVGDISRGGDGFDLQLGNGESVHARKVVLAIGVEHFGYIPESLAGLAPEQCTHASEHVDLAVFGGQSVAVVGGGQSALETSALLHENGATVRLLVRKQHVAWNGTPLALARPLAQRLREPESGLGSGWATWFYSNHPDQFRKLPRNTRIYRDRTALGPAGASWLRSRVEGQFPVLTGHDVAWAKPDDGQARLGVTTSGTIEEMTVDHVIAATGYRTDLTRLAFLESLRSSMPTIAGSPVVGRGYQSPVPGLYVIGPAVAPTFGPVMRFVFGTWHAAPAVTRQLAGLSGRKVQAAVPAGR